MYCMVWSNTSSLIPKPGFLLHLVTDSGSTANASVVSRPLLFSSLPVIASSAASPLVLTMMKATGICSKILSRFSFQSHCLQPFLSFDKGWVCSVPAPERKWWMHLHSILLQTRTVLAKWIIWSFPLTVLWFTSQSSLRVHEHNSFQTKLKNSPQQHTALTANEHLV